MKPNVVPLEAMRGIHVCGPIGILLQDWKCYQNRKVTLHTARFSYI